MVCCQHGICNSESAKLTCRGTKLALYFSPGEFSLLLVVIIRMTLEPKNLAISDEIDQFSLSHNRLLFEEAACSQSQAICRQISHTRATSQPRNDVASVTIATCALSPYCDVTRGIHTPQERESQATSSRQLKSIFRAKGTSQDLRWGKPL